MIKRKLRFALIFASVIITYFLFFFARTSAVAARGNDSFFGGEFLILLLPVIVYIIIENIKLSIDVHKQNKKKEASEFHTGIVITGIKSIDVVKGGSAHDQTKSLCRGKL